MVVSLSVILEISSGFDGLDLFVVGTRPGDTVVSESGGLQVVCWQIEMQWISRKLDMVMIVMVIDSNGSEHIH